MKYRVGIFLVVLISVLASSVVFAQESQGVTDEFEAFKKKLQNAQGQFPELDSSSQKNTAPSPVSQQNMNKQQNPANGGGASPLANMQGQQPSRPNNANSMQSPLMGNSSQLGGSVSGVASPLGVAANLPVAGQSNVAVQSGLNNVENRSAYFKKQEELAKQQAFEDGLDQLMPLAPEQIRALLQEFKKTREATETPITEPTPKTEVQTVSLDPSKPPIVIKTSSGYVTTITILDSTGAPWAIQDVTWAGKFNVTGGETGSHILRIIPQTAHGSGNISIRLVDLITPITFSLVAGLDEVHYRFDARIPKAGPLAKAQIMDSTSLDNTVVGDDGKMVEFLEGTPPSQAEKLVLNGVDDRTKAWRSGKNIYLRTPLTLLSPSWGASVSSADGMNVYTLDDAPVLLLSDQGRMVKAYVVNELEDIQ